MAAHSMTGFAEARAEDSDFEVNVAIRSVNHRSLDIKLRGPQQAHWLETRLRREIRRRVRRGSLYVTIEVDFRTESALRVDDEFIRARLDALRRVSEICGVPAQPDPHQLVGLAGAVVQHRPEINRKRLEILVLEGLERGLEILDGVRSAEGRELMADIRGHADTIMSELDGLPEAVSAAVETGRARLRQRLAELMETVAVEPQRLAQESAILAGRCDVSEELQRLRAHVTALWSCIENEDEVGKRIDFLAQEMNREANTLLSKAQHLGSGALAITESGIRIRAAIEKIREQAMNLE